MTKIIFLFFCISCAANDDFLYRLGKIESNNNDFVVGDGGKAISRYQIHYVCYLDAKAYDKTINFSYNSLTNKNNAQKVVIAYLSRYEPRAWANKDYESLARCWNGGCNWRKKNNEIKKRLDLYWAKFSVILLDDRNRINKRLQGYY